MEKVTVFNACASTNIGDQLIGDCFNYYINDDNLNVYDLMAVKHISEYKSKVVFEKRKKRKIGITLPKLRTALNFLKFLKLYRKKSKMICGALSHADKVIIGGGHLLIDTNLQFPLAIFNIVRVAKQEGKNVSILFVGCRNDASFIARMIYKYILNSVDRVVLRDLQSEKNFKAIVGESPKISAASDVALISDCITFDSVDGFKSFDIALCVMAPSEIERATKNNADKNKIINFWSRVVALFPGRKVALFTNGAEPDEVFVKELYNIMGKPNNVSLLEKPSTSEELIKIISCTDTLIAQRLHACLPGLALNKNVIGVKWDNKLESIFVENGFKDKLVSVESHCEDILSALESTPNWDKFESNKKLIKSILDEI